MPEFQRYATNTGQSVYFEIEEPTNDGVLERALTVLGALADSVSQEVASIPESKRPEDIDMSFDLRPGPEDSFAVAQAGQGHLRVTMRWSSDFAEDIGDSIP